MELFPGKTLGLLFILILLGSSAGCGSSGSSGSPAPHLQNFSPTVPNVTSPPVLKAFSGNGQVSLFWSGTGENYALYKSNLSGPLNTKMVLVSFLTTTSYRDTQVVNGTTYYYQVTATTINTGESSGSNEITATPSVTPPGTPTGLTASGGNSLVFLTWIPSGSADHYNVYRGTSPANKVRIATNIVFTQFADLGVQNGTPYYYDVTAHNMIGESAHSPEVSATPFNGGSLAMGSTLTVTVIAKDIYQPAAGFAVSLGSSGTVSQLTDSNGQAAFSFASPPGLQDIHVFSGKDCANVSIINYNSARVTIPVYCSYNDPEAVSPLFTSTIAGNISGMTPGNINSIIGATSTSDGQVLYSLTGQTQYTLPIESDGLSPYTLYSFENNGNYCNPYTNLYMTRILPSIGINQTVQQDIQFSTTPAFSITVAGNITVPASVASQGYAFDARSFSRLGNEGGIYDTGKCYIDNKSGLTSFPYSLNAFSTTVAVNGTITYGISYSVRTTSYGNTQSPPGLPSPPGGPNIVLNRTDYLLTDYPGPGPYHFAFSDVAGNITPDPLQKTIAWTAPSTTSGSNGTPSFYHLIFHPSISPASTTAGFEQWEFFLRGSATTLTVPNLPLNVPTGTFSLDQGKSYDLIHYSYTLAGSFDFDNASWTLDYSQPGPQSIDTAAMTLMNFYLP